MRIEECDTEEKFKHFLRNLENEIDEPLFQKLVATALKFNLNPKIFGGGGGGSPFGSGAGFSWSGSDTTAKRYARGISAPSRYVRAQCVEEIKRAFEVQ